MNWQWVLVTVVFGLRIGGEEKRWIRRYCEERERERGSYSIGIRNFPLLEALLSGKLLLGHGLLTFHGFFSIFVFFWVLM